MEIVKKFYLKDLMKNKVLYDIGLLKLGLKINLNIYLELTFDFIKHLKIVFVWILHIFVIK